MQNAPVCIPYAQNLRLPILSGILIQEPGGIGSFGLPSHAAKYGFVVVVNPRRPHFCTFLLKIDLSMQDLV